MQVSSVIYTLGLIPFMVIWSLYTGDVLRWMGLDEETARIGLSYARVAVYGQLLEGLWEGIDNLLEVTNHEIFSTAIGIAADISEVIYIFTAVTYHDDINLTQITYISLINEIQWIFISLGILHYKGWLEPFMCGLTRTFALNNKRIVMHVLKTSIPLALGSLFTSAEWEILTIFASYLGPAEVTTWGILGTIWGMFEAGTEGIADAAEIRVSYHMGKGQPEMAKISAHKSLLFSFIFSCFVTSIFFIIGDDLPTFLTHDPTIQHMIARLIPLVGIANITLTTGMVCWSLIGAQGRYQFATYIVSVCSWTVTIPVCAFCTYYLNIDAQGLAGGITMGYATTGTILSYFLFRSNWKRLSERVQEIIRTAGEIVSSDSSEGDFSSSSSSSSSSLSSSSSESEHDSDSNSHS